MIIRYLATKQMTPREGQKFATEYYKMRREQRNRLRDHIILCCQELLTAWDADEDQERYSHRPLTGFKRLNEQNRSLYDIVTEQLEEALAVKRNGDPKDFAVAPIARWNKIFEDTDYEIIMQMEHSARPNTFHKLYEELL
jgi:hypothetical protein